MPEGGRIPYTTTKATLTIEGVATVVAMYVLGEVAREVVRQVGDSEHRRQSALERR